MLEWGRWPCAARRARISRALVGRTSVPAVWINGQFVGGCNDGPLGGVNSLNEQGKLAPMLKEAGSLA